MSNTANTQAERAYESQLPPEPEPDEHDDSWDDGSDIFNNERNT